MNCRSVRECLVDKWDQADALQQDEMLQGHLQQCDSCQQIASEHRLSQQLLAQLPEEEPSENFDWRLRLRLNQIDKDATIDHEGQLAMSGEILSLPESRTADRGRWSMQFVGSAAAAALVVTAVGFLALQSIDSGSPVNSSGAASVVVQQTPGQETDEQLDQYAAPGQMLQRRSLPNLAPTRPQFLKVVPVSAGVPLGPEPIAQPAPSIIGESLLPRRGLPR